MCASIWELGKTDSTEPFRFRCNASLKLELVLPRPPPPQAQHFNTFPFNDYNSIWSDKWLWFGQLTNGLLHKSYESNRNYILCVWTCVLLALFNAFVLSLMWNEIKKKSEKKIESGNLWLGRPSRGQINVNEEEDKMNARTRRPMDSILSIVCLSLLSVWVNLGPVTCVFVSPHEQIHSN